MSYDNDFFFENYIHVIIYTVGGVILFSVGLTTFLLPFNLATSAPNGWASGYIIAMIVIGFVFLIAFFVYEKLVARTPMVETSILMDRTVIGACLLNATYMLSYFCWGNYFTSFLQVVNNITIAEAGYIRFVQCNCKLIDCVYTIL